MGRRMQEKKHCFNIVNQGYGNVTVKITVPPPNRREKKLIGGGSWKIHLPSGTELKVELFDKQSEIIFEEPLTLNVDEDKEVHRYILSNHLTEEVKDAILQQEDCRRSELNILDLHVYRKNINIS